MVGSKAGLKEARLVAHWAALMAVPTEHWMVVWSGLQSAGQKVRHWAASWADRSAPKWVVPSAERMVTHSAEHLVASSEASWVVLTEHCSAEMWAASWADSTAAVLAGRSAALWVVQ